MRLAKEEPLAMSPQGVDLIASVNELHVLNSQELGKLLRDSESSVIQYLTDKGLLIKIDMEKLAGFLPLHLIAVLISSEENEATLTYLLRGTRLLHSLCDLAHRHTKIEQILLDDMKVLEQQLDLVFYLLIVLADYRQENNCLVPLALLHSALVGCSLYLLTGFVCSQWQDLVLVLLAHPKVDLFMDAAFGSVRIIVRCLEMMLSAQMNGFTGSSLIAERSVTFLFQQCEACVQFLQSLCQQKPFCERLLKNKELCGKGSVLFLSQSILKLKIPPPYTESPKIMAAASRLKAKMLSILLSLCEAESISYLDEVSSSSKTLDLAKSVASEVLELLKTAFGSNPNQLTTLDGSYPTGLLQLNAMRLADIFSDDSNFRSYITLCFTRVLTAIFSLSHGEFLSCWCSSNFPEVEVDATIVFDVHAASGWVLDKLPSLASVNSPDLEFSLVPDSMPQFSYAHQRTSLFVKIIANLHCFVPTICEEQERNLFLLKVLECLPMDPSNLLPGFSFSSDAPKAATFGKNFGSLLSHAESLIPNFLNEEDVHLLRVFFNQLLSLITAAEVEEHDALEAQSTGGCSSPIQAKEPPDANKRSSNLKEGMSESSAFVVDQFNAKVEEIDKGDEIERQDEEKDKVYDKVVFGPASDGDKDTQNVETSGSDTSSTKAKNILEHVEKDDIAKSDEQIIKGALAEIPENEKVETVQRRKRKRTIMNDKQVTIMERALVDEPDMQRNAASIQLWADKLSHYGSEVTCSQLKNWLNNRKARLARTAKDARPPTDSDNAVVGKQRGTFLRSQDSPESPQDIACISSGSLKEPKSILRVSSGGSSEVTLAEFVDIAAPEFVRCMPGQYVILVNTEGEEIGKGKVHQVNGKWYGRSLEELETCVVDVNQLRADRGARLPYPSEATGTSFDEAEKKLGIMRVLWDSNKIYLLRPKSGH